MKRINRSTLVALGVPGLIACTTVGGDESSLGQARFALSSTTSEGTFRFLGSMDILDAGGDVEDTLVAAESSPPTHLHELPGGNYTLDIVDGDFGEVLVGAVTPTCSYEGSIPDFIGCTVNDAGVFGVFPGVTADVVIPVTFHFADEDVEVVFSTGTAEFTLVATPVVDGCDDTCTAGQICAAVDGVVGCYDQCTSDADCGDGTCTLVAGEGGENPMNLCIGGSGGGCAHEQCEVGDPLDPAVCGDCVANICAVDPFCCETAWDDLCVGHVETVCGETCGGTTECAHDQCEVGDPLDPAVCGDCVASVCAVDPFCCETAWDDVCVGEVGTVCGETCGGPTECAHDQCVVGDPLSPDPAVCGECVASVCAVDPFCCETAWDDVCVGEVGTVCGETCGGPTECAHDQCVTGDPLDAAACGECVGAICAVDPFCCETAWDEVCVDAVPTVCGGTCGGPTECAHDQCVTGAALDPAACGECVGAVCALDPFCCETAWDEICIGEVGSVCGTECPVPPARVTRAGRTVR